MRPFHKNLLALSVSAAVIGASAPAFSEEPASVAEALKGGNTTLSFRLRYEDVTVDNGAEADGTADLLSLKTRLTYNSLDFNGFGLGLEMDDVTHVTDYEPEGTNAGIADPQGTEVNQYFLTYKFGKSVAKYGRQRILLDNQRFVGGVGFRQNEQTYDAFSITSKDVDNLTLFAAYITNVNRIFGEQAAGGDHDNETILLNAKYAFDPAFNLTGYYYAIDNSSKPSFSSDTAGLRATGAINSFGYTAEFATQSEGGDNPVDYSASYMNLEGTYKVNTVKFTLGHEVLGADGEKGVFITPLATLHKFQGWTDQFLGGGTGNKDGGIVDTYFSVAGKAGPVKLVASYHMLSSDDASAAGTDVISEIDDYGTELGFVAAIKIKGVGLSLKYAAFSADDDSGLKDTDKLWLTAGAKF